MFYKNFLFIIFCILLSNCTTTTMVENKSNKPIVNVYSNKGFALIYSDDLFIKKIVNIPLLKK